MSDDTIKFNYAWLFKNFNIDKPNLKDIRKGETCIIIANGPSLADVPLDFFSKYRTFGVNNIYLHGMTDEEIAEYPNIPPKFFPTYYTILGGDQLDSEEKISYCMPVIKDAENAFVNRYAYPFFDFPHVYAIHSVDLITRNKPQPKKFSKEPLRRVGIGFTNIYISLQLAYWMGFTTALCVGLTNDYGADSEKLHFYKNDPRFATEPFMGRPEHQTGSILMFQRALDAFEANGRKIINVCPEEFKNNTPFEWGRPEEYW